jgi:hypothetical protein
MNTTASSFTLRKNAKRAAEAMIRKGAGRAVDYGIEPSANGRFEIVWKTAKTTDEVEIEIAKSSAGQPAAASPTEVAPQPAPAATEPATTDAAPRPASEAEAASQPAPVTTEPAPALSEPVPNEWPQGTRVMVRKGKSSWREATFISRLDPDHWRARGGSSGACFNRHRPADGEIDGGLHLLGMWSGGIRGLRHRRRSPHEFQSIPRSFSSRR